MLERVQFACKKVQVRNNTYQLKWRATRDALDDPIFETSFNIDRAVQCGNSAYHEEVNITSQILHHLGINPRERGTHTVKKLDDKEYEFIFSISDYHLSTSESPIVNGTQPIPKPKSFFKCLFFCCYGKDSQEPSEIPMQPLLHRRWLNCR